MTNNDIIIHFSQEGKAMNKKICKKTAGVLYRVMYDNGNDSAGTRSRQWN